MSKKKVLASVYSCQPNRGSEPGAGWNFILQFSKFAEVWAVTDGENRPSIEKYMANHPIENVHWVYYDVPKWFYPDWMMQRFRRIHYNLWQLGMYYNVAKPLHKKINFDVVHHLTWAQYWTASYLSLLDTTFVWGPVGGAESAPHSFYKSLSFWGKFWEYARDFVRTLSEYHPFVRKQARDAHLALTMTKETAQKIKELGAKDIDFLMNCGITLEDYEMLNRLPQPLEGPIRFVSIGRFIGVKAFNLGIQAFAQFHAKYPEAEYWLIGDGPERGNLEQLCAELGITEAVTFLGWIPRSEVLERLGECNVVVHPSLHDSSGWVPLEAGSARRPIICLNLGGSAVLVSDKMGFLVDAITPEQAIKDMALAMEKLAKNPDLIKEMGEAGKKRVFNNFLWDHIGNYFKNLSLYKDDNNKK